MVCDKKRSLHVGMISAKSIWLEELELTVSTTNLESHSKITYVMPWLTIKLIASIRTRPPVSGCVRWTKEEGGSISWCVPTSISWCVP